MIKLLLLFSLFLYEPQIVEVKIKGMVCSFCAQGLKKSISKLKVVEDVKVNLKKGFVSIQVKANEKLDMKEIEQIIIDSGYRILK